MRPRAMALETTWPYVRSGAVNSAAYRAAPVTFAGPSARLLGEPTWGSFFSMVAPLADALVDLRLRRTNGSLAEGPDHSLASQIDLEGVVLVAPRAFQQHVRGLCKGFLAG